MEFSQPKHYLWQEMDTPRDSDGCPIVHCGRWGTLWASGTVALWPRKHLLAAQVSGDDLCVLDVVERAREQIAVEHDQVGQLAGFERADLVVEEDEIGVVRRVEADGLLAREGFFGVQLPVEPFGPPRRA